MILSNVELHKAIDQKRLIIEPEPLPRFETAGQICPYDSHSVDLHLGGEIRIPIEGSYCFDMTQKDLTGFLARNCEKVVITNNTPLNLEPNRFILGITRESVELPIDNPSNRETNTCLAARIEGKSSRARCSLLVHFTAPTVHPGWRGPLTLEIINLGRVPFVLRPEMAIAQLIVEEVKGIPVFKPSDFQGQTSPVGKIDASTPS